MAAHKLSGTAKLHIIKALAHGFTPTEVVHLVEEKYGVKITRQTAEHYDPRKNPRIAPDLQDYFRNERRAYLRDLENISVESRAYRQTYRSKLLVKAMESEDGSFALRILDSAQKDATGKFRMIKPNLKLK